MPRVSAKTLKRQKAGRKAARTRKLNERANPMAAHLKRRKAALKAWRTRRTS